MLLFTTTISLISHSRTFHTFIFWNIQFLFNKIKKEDVWNEHRIFMMHWSENKRKISTCLFLFIYRGGMFIIHQCWCTLYLKVITRFKTGVFLFFFDWIWRKNDEIKSTERVRDLHDDICPFVLFRFFFHEECTRKEEARHAPYV
jgi:hypothetical protein